ncbi:hypothetical protein [Croceicoccus sp. YJ47]|uniref:hypothetical protein n=1 Tax=Croceicoccus sp. YJ47 TaxID=2798724 RepID=UPI0019238CA4|nr:hypothetical protein [Croceicoccus sp. YJ47]QQN74383.1 hypothetical protein JD971_00825 [Croceicoccus sp. YJ47]
MSDVKDPRDALAVLNSTNDRLAKRMHWPLWRHLAGGLLLTLIVGSVALPRAISIVAFVVAMVMTILLVQDDKKRHGMFVSGYQRGRTVWIVGAIVALIVSALIVVMRFDEPVANPWFWVTLSIVFLGTSGLSSIWERVYRKDVREGRL